MLMSQNLSMADFYSLIVFLIPIYIANSIPVVLGGGQRLDFGKNFSDGKPVFGEGKTIRGFVVGVAGGTVAAGILALYSPLQWFPVPALQFWGGAAMALGTMTGDAAGSFMKRRLGMESGRPFILDTMIFLAFALLLGLPFIQPALFSAQNLVFMFGLTIILHPATNFIANRLGLKKVPW
jgi:CDP-2,3-bis-(O-geranylgeranyl)-sn-glycerol synthase